MSEPADGVSAVRLLELDGDLAGSRRTAHEYVRDSLRRAILRGNILGGERLVQADIASELGVSTTPVREALRDLATEGLITLDAHRGAVVKKLNYEDLHEIHELTRLLEPEAFRLAAQAEDKSFLADAHALVEQMEATHDPGVWSDLNRKFHSVLVTGLPKRRLLTLLQGLRDASAPYIALALKQSDYPHELANRHHRQLLEAIRAGDGQLAAEITREHAGLSAQVLEGARKLFEDD
jgi:DNA-binding GntR family transcriptional regulator